jgi:hypothetical protein
VSSAAFFHHHSTHGAMVCVVTGHIQLDTSVFNNDFVVSPCSYDSLKLMIIKFSFFLKVDLKTMERS